MTEATSNRATSSLALVLALLAFTAMLVGGALPASAQELEWRDEWRRFGGAHAAATAAMGAGALGTELFWQEPGAPRWTGPILFDDGTRDLLLADRERGLRAAAIVSDVLVASLLAMPTVIDPAVAWLRRDSPDAAIQMGAIGLESVAASLLTVSVLKRAIGRQRPPFGDCYDDPEANPECDDRPNVSFPSGHSASAWVGAGLVCVMHEKFDLYGSGFANRLPCYGALTAASAVATLRIVSNNHYLSDTVVGSLIGFGAGYLLPKVLHFGFGSERALQSTRTADAALGPIVSPSMTGVHYTIRF